MSTTIINKFLILIYGNAYVYTNHEGTNYYLIKCKIHGYTISKVKGYNKRLECNDCFLEDMEDRH